MHWLRRNLVGIVAILWLVNWSVTAFIDRTVGLGARSA